MAASPRTAGLALGVGQEQGRVREHGIMRYDVVEEQRGRGEPAMRHKENIRQPR